MAIFAEMCRALDGYDEADRVDYFRLPDRKPRKARGVRKPHDNRYAFIVCFGRWPATTLKHRGYHHLVHRRAPTPEERTGIQASMRFRCCRYRTAVALLEDERQNLPPEEFTALAEKIPVQSISPFQ